MSASAALLGAGAWGLASHTSAISADIQWYSVKDPATGRDFRCLERSETGIWCYEGVTTTTERAVTTTTVPPTVAPVTAAPTTASTGPAGMANPQVFVCIDETWMQVTSAGFVPSGDPAACESLDAAGIQAAVTVYENCLAGIETWRCE